MLKLVLNVLEAVLQPLPLSLVGLGGNCVRYTASTCSNAIAVDAAPQACSGVEEKLSCRMREDGLKDCCCVTYDKF